MSQGLKEVKTFSQCSNNVKLVGKYFPIVTSINTKMLLRNIYPAAAITAKELKGKSWFEQFVGNLILLCMP